MLVEISNFAPEINLKQLDKKIRVGAVSYLNTKPLVYAFEKGSMANQIDLVFDYPAKIAVMLLNDEIDIGLIPVAVISRLQRHFLVSDYCIGASGPVASVCLFSDVPINEIQKILVDYQSRTSAALMKILLRDHWKIEPVLEDTGSGYQHLIGGTTAGLVIGDRALEQRGKSKYTYDLAEAWQELTGKPFVFAAWISNKELPGTFIQSFNNATSEGLSHIDEIVNANPFPIYDLHTYYTQNIDYVLTEEKKEAMNLFLSKISGQ